MPRQKDRQKDGQTLFYRTLPATTEDPKIVNKQKTFISLYCTQNYNM